MEKNFTSKASEAISNAKSIAFRFRHQQIDAEHLLVALLNEDGNVYNTLQQLNLDSDKILNQLEDHLIVKPKISTRLSDIEERNAYSTERFNKSILNAEEYADEYNSPKINEAFLFLAALEESKWLKLNLDEPYFLSKFPREHDEREEEYVPNEQPLEKFGTNLTDAAKDGKLDPVIGRDEEIRRAILILSRRTKNNPVLIGEPGVGKTAIVEGIAQRIVKGEVPSNLQDRIVYSLDITSILAGAKYKGEFEERIKQILEEVKNSNGKIVLFIDEIHTIVGAGKSEGSMDIGNILKPMLARGELRSIGATTIEEYRKYIEKDAALERRFQPILVKEPSMSEAISILRGLKEKFEVYHGIRIADSAIIASVELSSRYITDRFLPDKAIDLIDEAAATLKTEIESMPAELDELIRRIMQLEIEKELLKKEVDALSKKRLQVIDKELQELTKKRDDLKIQLDIEKSNITVIKKLKRDIELVHLGIEKAEREYDLNKLAELRYGELADLEQKLREKEKELEEEEDHKHKLLKEEVTDEEIAKVVSSWTGVPLNKLIETEKDKILNLEKHLNEVIIGQPEAVKGVAQAVLRARSGMKDPNKPIGTFLFLGPTGVGKTHLANSLAEYLLGDKHNVIRFDMSEYMDKFSVTRLIGAPPGYIGFEEGGQLTEQVKTHPYSIVLFDELEKAHKDVFNILLQIMDDGRLTDSRGKVVDFRNTIIIMTSNIGSKLTLQDKDDVPVMRGKISEEVRSFFKPEFVNRIDEIAVFMPLNKEHLRKISLILLQSLNKRLENRNIILKFTKKVVEKIIEDGYDPDFGARPLKRFIQREIETDIANRIINSDIKDNTIVAVNYANNKLKYRTLAKDEEAEE